MERRCEVLVLGIGNLLWADEGFGVRAVEALHAAYASRRASLQDGGTLGLNLYEPIARRAACSSSTRSTSVSLPARSGCCATPKCRRGAATKLSPHQIGFNDVLALARLNGRAPRDDRRDRRAAGRAQRLRRQPPPSPSAHGCRRPSRSRRTQLAAWGFPGAPRQPGLPSAPLNADPLTLDAYESGRPSDAEACRSGDPRLLARVARTRR